MILIGNYSGTSIAIHLGVTKNGGVNDMASRDKDLNDDEEDVKAPKSNKRGLLKWLLIGFGIVFLIGISVGTSIYVMKSMMSAPADKTAEKSNDKKATDEKSRRSPSIISLIHHS